MKQTEYDFSKCLFNPNSTGFLKSIKEAIPEFEQYKGVLPDRKLFTWIVVMFDLDSPIRKTITNYYDRKKLSAEIAVWNKNGKGEFEDPVTELLLGKDEKANMLIVAYLTQFSMPEYLQLIAYLNMSYDITRDIMKGSYDQNTAKTLDYITERIKLLTNIVFGSGQTDEIMAARKALYEVAEKERIKLNPESIVKIIIEEGELPDSFNPYPKGYKPEKIKFRGDEAE
jgi:hypothetical protein